MLELLYQKRNPLIMNVVDSIIFLKYLRIQLETKTLEDIIFARV